jgi:hypothetical protein
MLEVAADRVDRGLDIFKVLHRLGAKSLRRSNRPRPGQLMQHHTRDFGEADGGEGQVCRQSINAIARIATVMLWKRIKRCQ